MWTSSDRWLRALTATYGVVFLASALQNFGLRLLFGPLDFYFGEPIWQAGAGEAVIGVLLVAAALHEGRALYWTAYVLSVLGIAFGLSSARVVGAAREVHLVLVPLAAIGLAILAWRRIRRPVVHTTGRWSDGLR